MRDGHLGQAVNQMRVGEANKTAHMLLEIINFANKHDARLTVGGQLFEKVPIALKIRICHLDCQEMLYNINRVTVDYLC